MCLLALRLGVVDGTPVVLGANRDESFARPFDPPRLHDGEVPFVAPVDRVAGGTWLGLNAMGVVVAITNRPQREVVATRRSRGLLVADALRAPSVTRLRGALERGLRSGAPYNNFHLVAASATDAFLLRYHDGWLEFTDLDAGDHFLTNDDEYGGVRVPGVSAEVAPDGAAEAARLLRALGSHEPVLPGGRSVCKHDGDRGTVSAAVIALPEGGARDALFRFTAGPPCAASVTDCTLWS